jgi:hypothetical protein
MTSLFPGFRPIHGDAVRVVCTGASRTEFTAVGDVIVRGVRREGRGYAELVLPDIDPQQRRALTVGDQILFQLHRDGVCVYASDPLKIRDVGRSGSDGAVIVSASP